MLLILSLAVFISSRKYIENPLLTPKGIFNIACLGVEKAEDLTVGIMGEKNRGFSAYIVPLFVYLCINVYVYTYVLLCIDVLIC